MCGLYGFIQRSNKAINVNKLVKGMAVSAMSRGTHATGISYNNSGNLLTVKAAVPADKFVFDVPRTVSAVIGHTRHTTQGSEKQNYNNHPFNGYLDEYSFALAHNGVLDNDYELQESEDLPATTIQTDSYVAVQLLEKYANGDKSLTLDSILKMSELVSGMFAFSILDSKNDFWLVRNDSPIHMAYFKKLGLYVYGSTEAIVQAGLKAAGLSLKYQKIDVPVGSIVHIDSLGELSFFEFNPAERFSVWNPKYAIANGGSYTGSTKTKTTTTKDYDTDRWYNYQYEDMIRCDLYELGLTDDEIDLMLGYYTMARIDEALYSGKESVESMLLYCLRDNYEDTISSNKRESYTSPLHKTWV